MPKRLIIFATLLVVIAVVAVLAMRSLRTLTHSDPLAGTDQLVLVGARTGQAQTGVLQAYEREGDGWKYVFSCPVVLGRSGLAWGRGLHGRGDMLDGDPVKREGDGASPEGAFRFIAAYGVADTSRVRIDFPYTKITPDMVCCDDPDSPLYNQITTEAALGVGVSHEDLLRDDDVYQYLVVVGHNTDKPEPGAGSCIFLHVWRGPDEPTSGCTAMSEDAMLRLLSFLDAAKNPVLVQLSRRSYFRLKEPWGLPDVTM